MADTDLSTWFVAQLRPHGLALARRHLRWQGFETFSPEILNGHDPQIKGVKSRKPLFPGYLFVSFDSRLSGWTAINNTRGISRLILNDPLRPRPLPEQLMAELFGRCDSSELFSTGNTLEVGDRIRILSGPFSDTVTQIEALPDTERVSILVELLGREVRSSLHRSDVAKV
jgi:transcriptional antiterminator RfaH